MSELDPKGYKRILALIIGVNVGIKAAMLLREYPLLPSQDPYLHISLAIISKESKSILSFRPFWYSFSIFFHFILVLLAKLGVDLIIALILMVLLSSTSQTILFYLIGKEIDPRVGLISSFSLLFSPLYLIRSTLPIPENLAFSFLLLAIFLELKKKDLFAFLTSLIVALIHPLCYFFCLVSLLFLELSSFDRKKIKSLSLHAVLAIIVLIASRRYFNLISIKSAFFTDFLKKEDILLLGPLAFPAGALGFLWIVRKRHRVLMSWISSSLLMIFALGFISLPVPSLRTRVLLYLIPPLTISGVIFLKDVHHNIAGFPSKFALLLSLALIGLYSIPISAKYTNPPSSTYMVKEPMSLLRRNSPKDSLIIILSTSEELLLNSITLSQRYVMNLSWTSSNPSLELVNSLGLRVVNLDPRNLGGKGNWKEKIGRAKEVLLLEGEAVCPKEIEEELKKAGYRVLRLGGRNRYESMAFLIKYLWRSSEIAVICSADDGALLSNTIEAAAKVRVPILLFSDTLVTGSDNEDKMRARNGVIGALKDLNTRFIYPVGLGEKSIFYFRIKGYVIVDGVSGFRSYFNRPSNVVFVSFQEDVADFLSKVKKIILSEELNPSSVYVYIDPIYGRINPKTGPMLVQAGGSVVWSSPSDRSMVIDISNVVLRGRSNN